MPEDRGLKVSHSKTSGPKVWDDRPEAVGSNPTVAIYAFTERMRAKR